MIIRPFALALAPILLAGCAVHDYSIAQEARTRLMGLSEVDLESCLGVPDQHASFGTTDVLTYYATSTSSSSYAIPVVGGFGFSNGGYCHATFQLRDGHVTQILYSGEKDATFVPDSYCAPIMHTCLDHLRQMSAAPPAAASTGVNGPSASPTPAPQTASPAQATPPGAGSPAAAP